MEEASRGRWRRGVSVVHGGGAWWWCMVEVVWGKMVGAVWWNGSEDDME